MDESYGFVLLGEFYSEDEIKEDKMGGACGTCGREKKCYGVWVGKSKGKKPLGRLDINLRITLK